jgi:hypothetical protein
MAGIAIHIGLNALSEIWYGEPAPLRGPENDSRAMEAIAAAQGFATQTFLTSAATASTVRSAIRAATGRLVSGDSLILTFAGHGRPVKDRDGDEPLGVDQTWCLYERRLIDDDIYDELSRLQAGIRVLVISDSCFSGSVIEVEDHPGIVRTAPLGERRLLVRRLPDVAHGYSLCKQETEYNRVRLRRENRMPVLASVILLAACQDTQNAMDGDPHGLFTHVLLDVWADGGFRGSLYEFFNTIRDRMAQISPEQIPNWYRLGRTDPTFEAAPPFSLRR